MHRLLRNIAVVGAAYDGISAMVEHGSWSDLGGQGMMDDFAAVMWSDEFRIAYI